MLTSIIFAWDQLKTILVHRNTKQNKEYLISNISKPFIEDLVAFLEPFKECSFEFQQKYKPTLHLVVLAKVKLSSHLQIKESDGDVIRKLKLKGQTYLTRNWILNSIHKIACFLHPLLKLKLFTPEERQEVLLLIKKEIDKHGNIDVVESNVFDTNRSKEFINSKKHDSSKKKSLISEFINHFEHNPSNDEIGLYLQIQVFVTENAEDFDLIAWWIKHKDKFPHLFQIFEKNVCVPASSANAESKFSMAGHVTSDKPSLSPRTLDDIMLLKSSFDDDKAKRQKT